jgi:hypothetical protein
VKANSKELAETPGEPTLAKAFAEVNAPSDPAALTGDPVLNMVPAEL